MKWGEVTYIWAQKWGEGRFRAASGAGYRPQKPKVGAILGANSPRILFVTKKCEKSTNLAYFDPNCP